MKVDRRFAKDQQDVGISGCSPDHKNTFSDIFCILLVIFVFVPSVMGSLPIIVNGSRCPGTSIPPVASDEWGLVDAIDFDPESYPVTSNITYVWYGIIGNDNQSYPNLPNRTLYLGMARDPYQTDTVGTSLFTFFIQTDCDEGTGDPAHNGSDWAIGFQYKADPHTGQLKDLTLYNWSGSSWVTSTSNIVGYPGSISCTGTDKKMAEISIGIDWLIDPCSDLGCNNITLLSASSYAGSVIESKEEDVVAVNGSIHVNTPPTADAGPDQIVCLGYLAHFDGSNSTGGDEQYGYNDITLYEWDFDYDGNESNFTTDATGVYASHNYTTGGTYWVALRVTDNWGCCNTDIDGLNVTVIDLYPNINVNKTADKLGPVGPGTMINYTVTLNNTGDANLTYVEVTDRKLDSLELVLDANSTDGALNISEIWTYLGTYNVTEADACVGWVNNTASVNGTTICEADTWYSNSVNISVAYIADFEINKTAEYAGYPDPAIPGTQINYTIWINNTGNVTMTPHEVVDDLENLPYTLPTPIENISSDDVLNVSETWKYEFNITVTDNCSQWINNCDGWINNSVVANFTDPCGIYLEKDDWANVSTTVCQTADAGNDTIVCTGVAAWLFGNATGYDDVVWNTTAGCNGELKYPITGQSLFNATYTPPPGEEQCNLTFTATGPCANVTDNVTVYAVETPVATIRVIEPVRYR